MDISTIFSSIIEFLITFFSCFSLLFSSGQASNSELKAKNPGGLVTSFSVVSDTHIETNNSENYHRFLELLYGMKSAKTDTAVFLGDNVMTANFMENHFFYNGVKRISPAKNILVAAGNHDLGNGHGNYEELSREFIKLNSEHFGNHIDKPYYYKIINGCYMIFLATEESTVHSCKISEEQLNFLRSVLNEAKEAGAPIFVFNHHPIYMIDGVDESELYELLCGYDNLIYITGHSHQPFGEDSFEIDCGIRTVHLPRSTGDGYPAGDGLIVEVYEDKIILRACNFIEGKWLETLEYHVLITR